MNLLEYLERAGIEQPLPRPVMEVLEAAGPTDLTETLSQHRPALRLATFEQLTELALGRYRWLAFETAQKDYPDVAPGPESLFSDQLATAQWALKVATTDPERECLSAAVKSCLLVALETSSVTTTLAKKSHPRASQYAPVTGGLGTLAALEPKTWLTVKRGVRAGVLSRAFEHDLPVIQDAFSSHLEGLAGCLGTQTPEAYLRGVVVPHLDEVLVMRVNLQMEEAVVRAAAATYEQLLLAEQTRMLPLGAVFVGTDRQRIGIAILDKRGAVAATAPKRASSGWTTRALQWLRDQRVKVVVIPEEAGAQQWLDELAAELETSRMRTRSVSPKGVIEARGIDDPALRRVSPEEASAVVLARRAHRPLDEWCRVDPVRLNLAPVQPELDEGRLRETLQMVRERAIAQGSPLSTAPVTTGGIRARASAPLNPEITGLRDLRPGLQLNGLITNVTKFGAFVNIGLRQEGLVHISELSDEFVNEPHEVVQPGQRVSVRVISVDLDRGRIALSMRTESGALRRPPIGGGRGDRPPFAGGRSGGGRSGSGGGRPPGSASPAERSRALADLESLFKKD